MPDRLIYLPVSMILFLWLYSSETLAGNWSAEQWASGNSVNGGKTTLTADEAFILDGFALDGNHIRLVWQIAPGTYLYRDHIQIRQGTASTAPTIQPEFMPEASSKNDPEYGIVGVYRDRLELIIKAKPEITQSGASPIITLSVRYQGCADHGLCYPPVEKNLRLTMPVNSPSSITLPILQSFTIRPWQAILTGGLASLMLAGYLFSILPADNVKSAPILQHVIVRASAWWLLMMGLILLVRLTT